jgi:ribosome recycling factor
MDSIEQKKPQFDAAITHLTGELDSIRTGRAHPALVENLAVEYYGVRTPLLQLATITIPDSRSIVIQPWDRNSLKDIEKAIRASSLGLNPVNEGNILRLPIPALTEERRKELVKVLNQKTEEAHVSIRNVREDIWRAIRDQQKAGDISEDDMFRMQKELQKIVDDYQTKIKNLNEQKEKEIMTI